MIVSDYAGGQPILFRVKEGVSEKHAVFFTAAGSSLTSLTTPGYLVLGEAETPTNNLNGKLECLDAKAKIYKKNGTSDHV